jgi:hypothetical protein
MNWIDWYNSKQFQYWLIMVEGRSATKHNDIFVMARALFLVNMWSLSQFFN